MILSASQPYFAPFPGFFYKAHLSDVFVILDEVQFPRGTTWITRNRIKTDQGILWMTIPVTKRGLGLQRISDVRIYGGGRWRTKHLESLKSAYAHAPYFRDHLEFLEQIFSERYEKIIDLNMAIMGRLFEALGIGTERKLLSDLKIDATGTARIVEICKRLGADRFFAQAPAGKYLEAELFESAGISLEFFKPPSPVYPQLWGDFIPKLSAFDLVFNCGPKARDILLSRS